MVTLTFTLEVYAFGDVQGIKESVASELERFGDIKIIKVEETKPQEEPIYIDGFDLEGFKRRINIEQRRNDLVSRGAGGVSK